MGWNKELRLRILRKIQTLQMAATLPTEAEISKKNPSIMDDFDRHTIKKILSLKNPTTRKEPKYIRFLQKALKTNHFLSKKKKELTKQAFGKLFQKINYEVKTKHEAVFNFDEIGTKFYIILKGTAFVLLKRKGIDIGDDGEHFSPESIEWEKEEIPFPTKRLFMRYSNFYISHRIHAGSAFGEIALLNDVPRTATILCETRCEFITLSSENYRAIIGSFEQELQEIKIKFFKEVPIFANWAPSSISELVHQMTTKNYSIGATVFNEGAIANHFYLMLSGEVEISKTCIVNIPLYEFMVNQKIFTPFLYLDAIENPGKIEENGSGKLIKDFLRNNQVKPGLRRQGPLKHTVVVSQVVRGQWFGEEYSLGNCPEFGCSAKAISAEVSCLEMSKQSFKRLVRDKSTLDMIARMILAKTRWHKHKISSSIEAVCQKHNSKNKIIYKNENYRLLPINTESKPHDFSSGNPQKKTKRTKKSHEWSQNQKEMPNIVLIPAEKGLGTKNEGSFLSMSHKNSKELQKNDKLFFSEVFPTPRVETGSLGFPSFNKKPSNLPIHSLDLSYKKVLDNFKSIKSPDFSDLIPINLVLLPSDSSKFLRHTTEATQDKRSGSNTDRFARNSTETIGSNEMGVNQLPKIAEKFLNKKSLVLAGEESRSKSKLFLQLNLHKVFNTDETQMETASQMVQTSKKTNRKGFYVTNRKLSLTIIKKEESQGKSSERVESLQSVKGKGEPSIQLNRIEWKQKEMKNSNEQST